MGLDTVELVISFEQEFGLSIPDEPAEMLVTVRDVRDFILSEYARRGIKADPDNIFERIRDRTIEIANVRRERITLDTKFVEDLGLD